MPRLLLSLGLVFLVIVGLDGFPIAGAASVRFELIRARPGAGATRVEHLKALLASDRARQRMISETIARRRQRRRACELPGNASSSVGASSFEMPMGSGAYAGTGQYFVRFRVGTPAQGFLLVADTGSDLTWVNCRYRATRGGGRAVSRRQRPVFRADASSSFDPIRCSSEMCKSSLPFSLATCPTPATPCAYDYGYLDGSKARGFFANESATVMLSNGRKEKLKGLVIGCTSSAVGSSFRAADGVLGLGYSPTSFSARATRRFGGRFSYCLVDHLSPRNVSSYLTFGPNRAVRSGWLRSTRLTLDPQLEPFYAVGVDGVSVGKEFLEIPAIVWDVQRGGGVILDSGTSLTALAEPAYKAVTSALSRRLVGLPKLDVDPFEFCYNWTAPAAEGVEVPKLIVHLNGSARLEPPAKSYLIDVADGVKCIGLTSAAWPGMSTIGNILQQEHLWEYDIRKRRLRFKRSSCTRR